MKFSELDLPEALLRAVEDLGFEEPTPIQAQALPPLLQRLDVAGQAQTGTGKTACFLLAAMTRLLEGERPASGQPRAICIAPTRELAIQIASDADLLSIHTDLTTALAYGGTQWDRQARIIEDGVDIIVGTPGRLIDFYKRRVLRLDKIEVFVLDEADRMFDMGFIKDISYLFRAVPPVGKRQALLFSATLNQRVMRLAWRFMKDPVEIAIEPENIVVDAVEQSLYHVSTNEKVSLLLGLLEREQPKRALVFVNRKRDGEELCWRLNHNGCQAAYMSGDIPQKKRERIIGAYKAGEIDLLIATDVASRGLHVDDVSHVFNYDVPQDCEDYVHRIGRTARAGAKGIAITLACENYVSNLPAVEKYVGYKIAADYPEDELLRPDRAGRFRSVRGKPYTGWPPAGAAPSRRQEASYSGDAPKAKKRKRNRSRGGAKPAADGATTEAATSQDAAAAPAGEQSAAATTPAPKAPATDNTGDAGNGEKKRERRSRSSNEGGGRTQADQAASPPRKKRKRERRRIGDGQGLTTPGASTE